MLELLKKMGRIGRIIFFVIVVYVLVISLFLHFIKKDKPQISNNSVMKYRQQIYSTINNPEYQKTKENKALMAIYRMSSCAMMGEGCTDNPSDGDKNYSKSVFGKLSNLMILPFKNPPASGLYWVYNGLQSAGFVPKTYAAEGIGFAALKPIINLWKAFRDLAYMILVLILIGIGFMIMFRMKLNPQTVISVENALPKIVVALILITFSFAIAGFLIDLMYIIITLGISVMSNHGNFYNIAEMQNKYLNAGTNEIGGSMFPFQNNPNAPIVGNALFGGLGSMMALSQAFMNLMPDFLNQISRLITATAFTAILWQPMIVNNIATAVTQLAPIAAVGGAFTFLVQLVISFYGIIIGFIIGYSLFPLILFLLLSLTAIALIFRIFFLLFVTYLRILLMIVFSPIFMLFEAVPGKNAFAFWFKNLIAEIIVFPVVIVLFVVTYIIVNTPSASGNLWQPPFFTDMNPNSFAILLGFGLMFQIPEFVKLVKELIGAKDMPIGLNLGTFFGGATGVGGAGMGLMSQIGSLSLGMQALTGKNLHEMIGGGKGKTPPPCLPGSTVINTLLGMMPIRKIKKGYRVWTNDLFGNKHLVIVLTINKHAVGPNHRIVHLLLKDGRKLAGSLAHPTADGRLFKDLKVGDWLDNSIIVQAKCLKYRNKYTYDILPAGSTGNYWANNILIGSTLFKPYFITRSQIKDITKHLYNHFQRRLHI